VLVEFVLNVFESKVKRRLDPLYIESFSADEVALIIEALLGYKFG
jgi:hypothetical protein